LDNGGLGHYQSRKGRQGTTAYVENGQLDLDNNICERSIRPVTFGRKNYLFMGSEGGGKVAANAYTLIETCRMNGVGP
jgi:transposase